MQVGENFYAVSYATTQVTRVENVHSTSQNLVFRPLASLGKCHMWHIICRYEIEAFYVIGGTTDGYFKNVPHSDVHRFEIGSNQLVAAPHLNQARYGGSACELNGLIYVFWGKSGKFDNYLRTIETLDVASQARRWQMFELDFISSRARPMVCPID